MPVFKERIDPFFLPYIGQKNLQSFYSKLGDSTLNAQDNHLVAIAQASGAGKTRLCFAVGSEAYGTSYFAIFIRFCENDTATLPLNWLTRTIEDLGRKFGGDSKRRAEWALHLFRLFVYAHVEWAMLVANEFQDTQQSREACLRALQNGDGQKGVEKILQERWADFSTCDTDKKESDYLSDYLEHIDSLVGKNKMLLFFDEVGFLQGKMRDTFINLDRYVDKSATAYGRQNPDLYYALRLVCALFSR